MPHGKYTFYLHSDDHIDKNATAVIESISQPMRGDFISTATIAGSVLHCIDVRLPALLADIFDGQLKAGQINCIIAALSGEFSAIRYLQDEEAGGSSPCLVNDTTGRYERRRFTLHLSDEINAQKTKSILDSASSRSRSQLLRSLLICSIALYTLDSRLPRLLATLPDPPSSLDGLKLLMGQFTGSSVVCTDVITQTASENISRNDDSAIKPEHDLKSRISRNMEKLF